MILVKIKRKLSEDVEQCFQTIILLSVHIISDVFEDASRQQRGV